jgi:hypothetical protein
VSFFDPPKPRESHKPERPSMPPWVERPRGILLGAVAEEILLARTDTGAVALSHLGACADGFQATLLAFSTLEQEDPPDSPFGWSPWNRRADPAELLRFGVRYADGGKAELDDRWAGGDDERPRGPVVRSNGGGGGGGEWHQQLWFWPLPPAGPITFAVEWLARGIGQTLKEMDAAPIREAARRAQVLFAPEALPDGPGHTTHTFTGTSTPRERGR